MSDFNYRLLGDRLAVKRLPVDNSTAGGIVIPDTAFLGKPDRGVVIESGEGRMRSNGELIKMRVKVGDVVLYNSRVARAIMSIDEDDIDIMTEQDIIAVERSTQ